MHRVQRVPDTEAQGRVHTSAATVAVLPEADEVDVKINDKDLKIDTMRAQRRGRPARQQNRIRRAHHASAERRRDLRAGRALAAQEQGAQAWRCCARGSTTWSSKSRTRSAPPTRRGQVGSGDRSQRIRTYNYPQARVTDHRINLTLHKLPQIMEGEALHELIDALVADHQAALLADEGA